MNRAYFWVGLLLGVAAVVLVAGGSAQAGTINRVPLNISGAFNMDCIIGPIVASQATFAGSSVAPVWLGYEKQGFAYLFGNSNQNQLVCDTSSNDGLAGATYKYNCTGYGSFAGSSTLTGSQGLPENGLIYSAADTSNPRTYVIASVSGNYMLPGDWTEPAYNSNLLGTWINTASTLTYGPNTYTASNYKFNGIWVGQTANGYGNANTPFVTASFQPAYYSDINLLLAGSPTGCAYTQIWATYADVVNGSSSLKLYDWGTSTTGSVPIITGSSATSDFTLVYKVGAAGRNGSSSKSEQVAIAAGFIEYLWEFTNPLTLDPNRVLVSITISSYRGGGNNSNAMAVFAATASASATASNTLTLQQSVNGTISAAQGEMTQTLAGYPYGATVTLTSSASPGYAFIGWTVTPAGHGSVSGNTGNDTLTIYGNVTVSASFAVPTTYSGTETGTGGSIILSDSGPYTYNQVITATASAQAGYTFAGWNVTGPSTLSSSSALTTTLAVYGNFTLTANFAANTLTAATTLDKTWVYQNMAAATLNRQFRTMIITVQDTWPDTSYTVVVTQSGSGVVVPSLTFETSNGTGAVTPVASFVFSGSSAMIYLVGGPLQADGVTGTGSCTVTVQVTGNASALATTTTQAMLSVRRLGDDNGSRAVTTADRVQLRKWLNGLATANQTAADFDLDGDGAVTTNDLALLNDLLNKFALPPTPLTLTAAASPIGAGTVTVTPSKATYYYGDQSTIVAAANAGYVFSGWAVTGGTVDNNMAASTTLTVQSYVTLTANYIPVYTLTMSAGPQGTVVVSPSQANYYFGDVVRITMSTITAGNVLDHWVLNGPGTLSNSGALSTLLTFAAGNATLTAYYTSGSYVNNLSPTASDSNVGSLASPFKTITRAIYKGISGWARPGDTIVVLQGRYNEQVNYGYGNNGTADQPITLRSNPGDRVIADGAMPMPLAGQTWTPCTSDTASGNPNYAHIYYTDINWSGPYAYGTVFEDETPLVWSKTPSIGWWSVTATTDSMSLIDSVNLTQTDSNYWVGAKIFYFDMYVAGCWLTSSIQAFNPATNTLTLPGGAGWPAVGDAYVIENYLPSMNGPGQVVVWPSGSNYRVFVWPRDNDRPDGHLFEGSYNYGHAEIPMNKNYLTLNGLEVAFSNQAGINPSASYATIQNCVIHHNDVGGVTGGAYVKILNNLVTWSGNERYLTAGLAVTGHGSLVQGNEVAHSSNDNIDFCANSSSLVGNYIHNADLYGHADNFQVYANVFGPVGNILVQDNYLIDAESQQCMMQQLTGITFSNNAVIFGGNGFNYHADVNDISWLHNTCGLGPQWWFNNISGAGIGFNLDSNIWIQPTYAIAYVASNQNYTADYNLYWHTVTTTNTKDMVIGLSSGNYNFADYAAASSQDTHGLFADPKFANMAMFHLEGSAYNKNNSPTRYYVGNGTSLKSTYTGDYFEIDRDGVRRQITNVSTVSGYVDFTPSKASVAFKVGHALNWKNNSTNWAIDLRPQAGSPAIGAGSSGTNIGCNLNLPQYEQGNFGVYGKRPVWPVAPVNLAATGWSYLSGGTPHALAEGGTYTNPNMTGFKLSLDAPLYAPSCTNSLAVTVVDNTGTTYPINAAALDTTGAVLTIALKNGALPRTLSWIEVIVNPAIMGANGTDPTVGTNGGLVTGVKSVRFTIN